jgi:NRAMP (natural resistance-associated macrophage protein)-like metal ion transporter
MPSSRQDPSRSPVVESTRPRLLQVLGPGLITGASDDDPSGIATYSQAGAQFAFGLTWTMLFTYPLMVAVQMVAARLGRTTGRGIAGLLRRHAPNPLLQCIVLLLLVANTVNIGADLGAMADATRMLVGGPQALWVVLFGALCVSLQLFLQYARYVAVLKWLTLVLFAYVGTLFFVHVPWGEVAVSLLLPHLQWDKDYLTTIVAVLGTTISPYLFFWQASQEAEDLREDPERDPLIIAPEQGELAITRIELDTLVGMGLSNAVALAIIVTAAATLHAKGITDVQTSAQAAEALRPIAGGGAFLLFTLGVVGTGLLAVPVLAGSAAYAIGEARKWPVGLARQPMEAKAFYATVSIATMLGGIMNFTPLDPIKALYWSAVVNGIVAVPVMAVMIALASRHRIMGAFTIGPVLKVLGWVATVAMGGAAVAMIVATFV